MDPNGIATQFLNAYYKTFSENRGMLQSYYGADSKLSWENAEFTGAAEISQKLTSINAQKIEYLHVEHVVQVLPGDLLLLLVNGHMSIDGAPALGFSQIFVLQRTPAGSWFIRNEIFKFQFASK
ncbi:nuclear transport factor 2 [Gregarina niphandrodes]|uniref:Nuclear transport factor 2 n=1 Tax=Gregarina niphandrodes TaxID=110365 RepID=A0A023B439_GRENI|nr:nuclear transport factor 2 [Gregarina niphandrodes]EZG56364.1 nuclear transport factor 2 [Gregarina niphandrodes]|eukprot:XP_011131293.1 nuclear transport factor 2 [Gregarina niphandrodes]